MGSWSVVSAAGRFTPLNTSTNFGTNFYVTFRIKYTASTFGSFSQPAKMEWDEVIWVIDRNKGEMSEFAGNMYTHKPASPTVAVWAQRYFRAYLHAKNLPTGDSRMKGHSKLFDKNGVAVPGTKFGTYTTVADQNKAVENYLKSNGGILEIEVHDIPSFVKPVGTAAMNKERLLTFNCGAGPTGPRVKAWQYIAIDTTKPPDQWRSEFQMNASPPGIKTTGLRIVPNPGISTPNTTLPSGGIW
jgi:hypothetical protein